ncbi:MAG: ADP-glyceromanno-heptose 6-epimerase [Flavobacteriales bacterium]|nr:ADP-glyceromanno-heptose 6-epimerase [Flavobacteriales bacterium]|tara:strand:+ start:4314 stop:5279 length:966 start_codon:yes stop_codon:yes gene_type:complete
MIVITGAAGFISSCLVAHLNEIGYKELILVDDFTKKEKKANFENKTFKELIDRKDFTKWLDKNHSLTQMIIHLGARTDTTEFDETIFAELNVNYSKSVWNKCVEYALPLIYASSAATYGLGEYGYEDNHEISEKLKPLNPYGVSKNDFDIWALKQEKKPFFWAGLKFFNVYGPNEFHKGRMASVIFHTFNQIQKTGAMNLFRSHVSEYKDGEQLRDFIYVKDVVKVITFLMENRPESGLYNLGTGEARTFYDLAANTFKALNLEPNIGFIDTPEDIRDKYQYFTEANIQKLLNAGYKEGFKTLEEGVNDYVTNHLIENKIW